MLVSLLVPEAERRVRFDYSSLRAMPDESGCYALAVFDGTILYIGQSKNIYARMEQHLDGGEKTQKTPWGVAFWLYYKCCPVSDLDNLENGWMNEHLLREGKKPFFNKVLPPA